MQQSNPSPKTTIISDFYKRYPYPKVDRVEYDFNLADHFHYLAGSCTGYDLAQKEPQRRGRMLIAGCGTREAVMWAFSLPHFDIDAIDISEASLDISKHLAQQLELTNVNFIHGNFEYREGIHGQYDFVHSFGVLHHLENPERGLAHLEKALKPNGLLSIMVYNDANRIPLQRAQRLIHLLTHKNGNPETAAHRLVERGARTSNRLQGVFQSALKEIKDNPQQFADTMLNPREVSYNIPSLVEFLKTSGLEIVSPALPIHWRAESHLTAELKQTMLHLSLLEKMEICDHLDAPLFWVLAQRKEERKPPRPCSVEDHLFWGIIPLPLMTGRFPVDQLQLKSPQELTVFIEEIDQDLVSISRGPRGERFRYPHIAKTMVELIDGQKTLQELAELACRKEGVAFGDIKTALLSILHELIDVLALATPDYSKCTHCPARCSKI